MSPQDPHQLRMMCVPLAWGTEGEQSRRNGSSHGGSEAVRDAVRSEERAGTPAPPFGGSTIMILSAGRRKRLRLAARAVAGTVPRTEVNTLERHSDQGVVVPFYFEPGHLLSPSLLPRPSPLRPGPPSSPPFLSSGIYDLLTTTQHNACLDCLLSHSRGVEPCVRTTLCATQFWNASCTRRVPGARGQT